LNINIKSKQTTYGKQSNAINSYHDSGWFQSHKNGDDLGMVQMAKGLSQQ
jgi:hypothetical protein